MRQPAGVHAGVWDAVCLAALAAMDGGRRQLAARLLQARQAADGPSSSPHPPPPPPTSAQLVPTVLCYTCLYSEKETQGPARLRPGKKGGREGRSRC